MGVDPFQGDVARVALSATGSHGFALAGGNALVVHGLLERPTMDVDLFPPVPLDVGPVLHIDDAVGSKVTAMAGRGLPRDFVDVAAASARYTREELLGLAFTRDTRLRAVDFSYAMIALDRIPDGEFLPYGLGSGDIAVLRERYSAWPRDVAADPVGEAVRRAIVDNVT